jgi:hypothetical protein
MQITHAKKQKRKPTKAHGKPRASTLKSVANEQHRWTGPIQFNWRREWEKKVVPYLNEPLVQASLDTGMRIIDSDWKSGDAPHLMGCRICDRVVKGALSWYQPLNRCHHIALFRWRSVYSTTLIWTGNF